MSLSTLLRVMPAVVVLTVPCASDDSALPTKALKSDDSDSGSNSHRAVRSVPQPTARQLQWAEMEMAALVHFNMASTHNCSDPQQFSPEKLNVDQWVQSFVAFGAREAVLVAKHACGFCTWPSNATLPDGSRYPYSTAYSTWRGGTGDVVGDFVTTVAKAGLGVGYYYSLHQLGSHIMDKYNFSAAQIRAIEQQQLTELWGLYGNAGNLSEVWFDGGIDGATRPMIKVLLQKFQPNAMAFNSCGGTGFFPGSGGASNCVTANAIRDTGTEAGAVANPNWSTQTFNDGRELFVPSESDTTLQLTDSWFYDASDGLRSLAELQDVYHQTVGHNSLLMMDFSPTAEGIISPKHAARYAEFGQWQRGCYDAGGTGMVGIAEHALGSEEAGSTQLLKLDRPRMIDRVVVREDQTQGQTILQWEVQAQLSPHSSKVVSSMAWTRIANGTSMGNKWIVLLEKNLTVSAIRTVATTTAPGTTARIRSTSAHLCSRAKANETCNIRQDWAADGVGNSTNRNGDAKTIAECCDSCTKTKGCALFVAKPNPIDGHGCILWSATGVGGQVIKGAVTGTPQR
eukprot:SAG31_NODE_1861_length_7044_cov_169.866379_1_plen_569_part_00